jgi:hypothetical protein
MIASTRWSDDGRSPERGESLATWAKANPGPEADLVAAVLTLGAADTPPNRAAVEAASGKSVLLRNEARGLLR